MEFRYGVQPSGCTESGQAKACTPNLIVRGMEFTYGVQPSGCTESGQAKACTPNLCSEVNPDHQLHDARVPRAAHGSEAVDVVDGAVWFEVKVRWRRIRQAGEIERGIDAAELSVVEHVE